MLHSLFLSRRLVRVNVLPLPTGRETATAVPQVMHALSIIQATAGAGKRPATAQLEERQPLQSRSACTLYYSGNGWCGSHSLGPQVEVRWPPPPQRESILD